jgi:uncharacterized membrane protein
LGAGIVHVAVLLLLPLLSQRDAWTRFSAAAEPFAVTRIDAAAPDGPVIPALDPFFMVSACRFDLSQGPLVVSAQGQAPFWSASVIGANGAHLFSFNDQAREEAALSFIVLTPAQMAGREVVAPPEGADGPVETPAIFAEVGVDQGMVVVRAFAPDDSFRADASVFLDSLNCAPEPE